MIKGTTLLLSILMLFSTSFTFLANAEEINNVSVKYGENKDKNFVTADKFYKSLANDEYKEYKESSVNIREKVLFKDSEIVINKISNNPDGDNIQASHISPDRQVYIFASIVDNKNVYLNKYVIYDAETKEKLFTNVGRIAKKEGNFKGWETPLSNSHLSNTGY